jgi:Haemolymph juvenile hormone binding protein (JHBP)
MEPMHIDDIIIERGRGFYISLKNIRAFQISNFNIEKLRVNTDNFNIDVIVNIPNVRELI